MAERLLAVGIANARGFARNNSKGQRDEDSGQFGGELVESLGLETHFVIDSSRNGNLKKGLRRVRVGGVTEGIWRTEIAG